LPFTSSMALALDFAIATFVPLSKIDPVDNDVVPMNLVT
jgi:hypothetical protein